MFGSVRRLHGPREAVREYFARARCAVAGKRLKNYVVAALRIGRSIPRTVEGNEHATAVAAWLDAHRKIAWVSYPSLPGDRYHNLAKKYVPRASRPVDRVQQQISVAATVGELMGFTARHADAESLFKVV